MRQGGMKPKSHTSGVYWVRAGAKGGGKQKKTKHSTNGKVDIDTDGDGIPDTQGYVIHSEPAISDDGWALIVAIIFCLIVTLFYVF